MSVSLSIGNFHICMFFYIPTRVVNNRTRTNVNNSQQPPLWTPYRVFQKKTHSFTHDKFGTVRRKMKIFAPKCSAENRYCALVNAKFV